MHQTDRRQWMVSAGALGMIGLTGEIASADSAVALPEDTKSRFTYCLNMSTIRGQKLTLPEQVDVAGRAGYNGIEPWIREIEVFVEGGGKLSDIKKQVADYGMTVDSAIGFANWIVDDPAKRREALDQARRDMGLVKQIGGNRIAAPPTGATKESGLDLFAAAERYHALLEVGQEQGVIPQLELWGFSANLSRLGELAFVATEAGHPDACVLPDVYHIYKGGSDFAGLEVFSGDAIHVFHINDYPATPPRSTIGDADRVFPTDGVAPLSQILQTLARNGFQGALSLELFNRSYWEMDAATVAQTGLAKSKLAVERAFANA